MELFIREFRLQKGLTLTELSKLSGVSVSYLSEVENGKKEITLKRLCNIAKALKVQPEKLYKCT